MRVCGRTEEKADGGAASCKRRVSGDGQAAVVVLPSQTKRRPSVLRRDMHGEATCGCQAVGTRRHMTRRCCAHRHQRDLACNDE